MRPTHLAPLLALAACPSADKAPSTGDTDTAADTDTADTDTADTTDTATADDTDTTPPADTVAPVEAAGRWTFTDGDLLLEVDPAVGARVSRLAWAGQELLTDATVNPDNWGATFWTSPQSAWSWPPPPAIDDQPYTATLDGDALVLTSAPAEVGGATFVVEKRITAGNVVTQTYTIRNTGTTDTQVAGWQVARVPADGLTVWPAGNHVTGTLGAMPTVAQDGYVWISDTPASDAKVIADATGGWIAHVTGTPAVALIVRYDEVRLGDAAPGEGEVEVFAKGGGGYREVEVQSAYRPLAAGESMTWTVTWEVRPVPTDVPVVIGSAALLDLLTAD